MAAELITIHLRHDYVADNQSRGVGSNGGESLSAVAGGRQRIATLFENVLKEFCLGGAVLYDEDAYRGRIARSGFHKMMLRVEPSWRLRPNPGWGRHSHQSSRSRFRGKHSGWRRKSAFPG